MTTLPDDVLAAGRRPFWRLHWNSPNNRFAREIARLNLLRRVLKRFGLALASDLEMAEHAWHWHCAENAARQKEITSLKLENMALKAMALRRMPAGEIEAALDFHRLDGPQGEERARQIARRLRGAA